MFRKIFNWKTGLISLISIFVLSTVMLLVTDAGAIAYSKFFKGNVLFGAKIHVVGTGIETMRIGYVSSTQIRIDAPGSPLLCVGLAAGADEIGTTEGYTKSDTDTDFLRFTVQLPDTWLDLGNAGDLKFDFDLHEAAGEEVNIDVRIFEYGNATPIITDTMTVANGAARAWVSFDTLDEGIGADSDLGPGDVLLFEITSHATNDDFKVYGVRMNYTIGIEKVS